MSKLYKDQHRLITPTVDGDYQARLSNVAGCKYFSNIYAYSVSIENIVSEFKTYPNPSDDYLNLSWNDSRVKSLEIYNFSGQLIEKLYLNHSKVINTSRYPDGFYLLKVNYNQEVLFFQMKHLVRH